MIINDPALLTKLTEWRHKGANGTLTLDDMREAVKVLRANRLAAGAAAAKSKSGGGSKAKKSSTPVDAGSLLDQLNGL